MFDRRPLSLIAASRLQKMIAEGELRPGDRLPSQRVMSDRMGISRPSLREALMTLETLGVVRTYPGKGTFVARDEGTRAPDASDWRYGAEHAIADVFEMRCLLEARLARHAALCATAQDIAVLTELTDRMEAAWAEQDLVTHVDVDSSFHRHIAGKTSNSLLAETYRRASPLLIETQRRPIPFTPAGRMTQSIAEHRKIIAALERRDADAAEGAMAAHVRNTAAAAGVSI